MSAGDALLGYLFQRNGALFPEFGESGRADHLIFPFVEPASPQLRASLQVRQWQALIRVEGILEVYRHSLAPPA
jgi:hypothetical protein